jgi:hypothetical protein
MTSSSADAWNENGIELLARRTLSLGIADQVSYAGLQTGALPRASFHSLKRLS